MIAKLSGHSLTVSEWFRAERMALNLSERDSTATITVGPDAPAISVGDWLKDDTEPGSGMVWRVKSIDTAFEADTRTIQCEHVISTLRDRLMFGEIKPADITGNPEDTTCTAEQAAQFILYHQSDWQLGTFGFSKTAPYNFNGDDLFSALETVSSSLMNAEWTYSTASYPFTVNIAPRNTSVGCEMRMDRNIRTLRRTIDRTRMFTRFYPIGKNNLHIDGDYVSKNESTYGVISKVETDGSKATTDELEAWANERLNNHAEPVVTVTISGLELSAATGESLDHLVLGTVCRVPLPEYDTTITERITKLSWSDKIGEPENVTVTLANNTEDVASIINEIVKSGGAGGRAAAAKDGEDHAWIVDADDHISLVAEAISGKDEEGNPNWSRVSELTVDGNGIEARVIEAEGDIIENAAEIALTQSMIHSAVWTANSEVFSYIDQTATYILSAVDNDISDLHSEILQTQNMIHSAVFTANSQVYSYIDQTATSIMSVVGNDYDDLHSEILQTQNMIHSAVWTANSQIYSYIDQTATSILSVVEAADSALGSSIQQTANDILAEVHAANSALYSYVDQTATSIISVVEDVNNDLGSAILQTASQIRTEVHAADSALYSYVDQTATSINTVVASVESSLGSQILQTANEIYTTVYAADSQIYSYVDQTATSISSVVASTASNLGSEILQTANEIYSTVYAADSAVYSYVDQTATSINTVVANTASGLQSSINQTASQVAIVVDGNGNIKAAQIVASINNSGSSVNISADKVRISGTTNLNDIMTITDNRVYISQGARINGDTMVASLTVRGGSDSQTITEAALATTIKSASVSGNTLTLTQYDGTTITFNKAASKVSGSWSGGTFTVSANDNGQNLPLSTAVYKGTGAAFESWDGNTYTGTIVYYPDGEHQGSVGRTFTVDATDRWNDGYDNAKRKVVMPSAAASGEVTTFTALVPNDARNGQVTKTFTLSKGTPAASGYASVSLAGTGVVGRIDISDWYTGGQNSVNVVAGTWTTRAVGEAGRAYCTFSPSAGTGASYTLYTAFQFANGDSYGYTEIYTSVSDSAAGGTLTKVKGAALQMTAGGWNNGSNVITLSSGSNTMATLTVTAPATKVSGSWSNGTYTVSANSSGQSLPISTAVYKGTGAAFESWSGNTYTGTIVYLPDGEHQGSVGRTFTVDATSRWEAGYDDAKGKIVMPAAGTSDTFTVLVPNAARNGKDTKTFTITKGTPASSGYASVSLAGTGVVGRIDISDWFTGGQNSVNVTAGSWTTRAVGDSGRASRTYSPSAGTGSSSTVYIALQTANGNDTGYAEMYASAADSSGGSLTKIKGVAIQMTAGGWSGNSNVITLATLSGSTISRLTVTAPTSVTWSKTWSSGHLTVTASPYGSYNQYIVDSGVKQNSDGSTYSSGKYWYVPVYYKDSASSTTSGATGLRVYVNATNVYNDCWATVVNFHLGFYYNQGSGDYFSVKYPKSTVDTSETADFVLSCSGGTATVSVRSTGTTCCQKSYASNSAVLYRATTSISSGGASTGPGKLYVYNSTNNTYGYAGPSSNRYWYYSTTGITGGTTVYY